MTVSRLGEMPLIVSDFITVPPVKRSGARRLIDLAELVTLKDSDYFVVDDGIRSFKVKASTVIDAGLEDYSTIYTDDGDTASPAVTQTPGTTPVLYTGFSSNGPAQGATADAANNKHIVATAGVYLITAQFAFSGAANSTFNFSAAIISESPASVVSGTKTKRRLGGGGDVGSCSLTGLASLSAGQEIAIFIDGTAGDAINTHHAQFTIHRVG